MPDAATLAVLRDVISLTIIAIALGVVLHGIARMRRPALVLEQGGNVIARYFALPDAYLMSIIIGVLIFGITGGGQGGETAGGVEPKAAPSFMLVLTNVVFMLGLCVCLLLYLVMLRGLNPATLFGLRRLAPTRAAAFAMASIVPLYILVASVAYSVNSGFLEHVWPNLNPQDAVKAFQDADSMAMQILLGISAVIVAPLVEETVFRGFIYGVLKRYTDGWFAAVCSALFFSVVHMHVGSFVPLFILALGFCAAYEMTGCLLVPILMHALFNGTSIMLMFAIK